LSGLARNLKKNNETIQESLKEFVPLYNRLHVILQKTNEDVVKDEQLVLVEDSDKSLTLNIKDKIDVKSIADYSYQNDCIKILLKTNKTLLAQKLKPLKEICDISAKNNLLSE
jgi:hypothetical protein